MKTNNNAAFTIIELIILLGVILLVAGVLGFGKVPAITGGAIGAFAGFLLGSGFGIVSLGSGIGGGMLGALIGCIIGVSLGAQLNI